jgi:hypothetical protein
MAIAAGVNDCAIAVGEGNIARQSTMKIILIGILSARVDDSDEACA